jgi:predicted esterase
MAAAARLVHASILAGMLASAASAAIDAPIFDIPRLDGIIVDGNAVDWAEGGFRVDVLLDPGQKPRTAAGLDAFLRLGWNDRGLLALLTVTDAVPVEDDKDDALWRKDSVELFVATGCGERDVWQAVIAPGMDPKHPDLRTQLGDFRASEALKKLKLTVTAARAKTAGGYVLEVLLPWENLAIRPERGREIAFQVWVNDADASGGGSRRLWFPEPGAQFDTRKMHRLKLAASPSRAVVAAASGHYELFRRTRVNIAATAAFAGETVRVREGRKLMGEGKLAADGRLARASVVLPMPPRGKPYGRLSITMKRGTQAIVDLPNPDVLRNEAFTRAEMGPRPCVFSGEQLPPVDFEQPSLVEDIIGPYTVRTSYYDANYEEVTAAGKPGRYGAIVEIQPQSGPITKRFFTLFRAPEGINWRRMELPVTIDLPSQFGIDPAIAREQAVALADLVKSGFRSSCQRDTYAAVVLARLYEAKPGTKLTQRNGVWATDTKWWHELKRKTGNLAPLRYLVHLPPGTDQDTSRRWPTILFLHGAGERGDDLERVTRHGPPKIVKTRKDFPFIVISPQCPDGIWWSVPALDDLLKEVTAKYPVDTDRLYLTGLSMGGFGSWALATEYPDRFAAVVPICGAGDPQDVDRIKDVPVWVFHGARDPVVPLDRSTQMVDALRKLNGRVKLTIYPEADHDSWTATYENQELYDWLLRQARGKPQQPLE